ncbi:MAG: hypothetical protein ACFE9N_12505 [Promethearchaeota archaeon]
MSNNNLNVSQLLGILLIYLAIQTPISALINNLDVFTFSLFISLFLAIFGIILLLYSKY